MKFIISPGLPRSGTTYLQKQLAVVNRDAFNAPRKKETNIFWLGGSLEKRLSDQFDNLDLGKPILDFSPSYLSGRAQAVVRIGELALSHDVKILLHLRHPVEQAYAHYVHDVASHVSRLEHGDTADYSFWSKKSFDRYLVRRASLVKLLVDSVGRDNIHVVNFHHDLPDPDRLTRQVSAFLGVELQPFQSSRVGIGGRLPYYIYAGEHPVRFVRGDEIRSLPRRQVMLVGHESARKWHSVDERFAAMLMRGQSSWTRSIDRAQIETLWRSYFEADFREVLDLVGGSIDDYPMPQELTARVAVFTDTHFARLGPDSSSTRFVEDHAASRPVPVVVEASGGDEGVSTEIEPTLTAEDVTACYRVFFGREPESKQVVNDHVRHHRTLQSLLGQLIKAPEFGWAAQRAIALLKANPNFGGHVETTGGDDEMLRLIAHTRSVWAQYGEQDAFFSVLTNEKFRSKNIGERDVAEFYASGAGDAQAILDFWSTNGKEPNRDGTILDLGCGLGRIGEHLSGLFARYIGVDISKPHLDQAARRFEEIGRNNGVFRSLPDFMSDEETVDAVFSVIVLQHNPPPVIALLIERMCKALRSGGLLYFQVPVAIFNYNFDLKTYLDSPPTHGQMEMHCIPQREIYRILAENSCQLLEAYPDGRIGNIGLSYTIAAFKT